MMLHESSLKTLIIKRISNYTNEYTAILGNQYLIFEEKVGEYIGVKNHHGHPFLVREGNMLTYPRGVHGKLLVQTYMNLKEKKIYARNISGDTTFKVRLKK